MHCKIFELSYFKSVFWYLLNIVLKKKKKIDKNQKNLNWETYTQRTKFIFIYFRLDLVFKDIEIPAVTP